MAQAALFNVENSLNTIKSLMTSNLISKHNVKNDLNLNYINGNVSLFLLHCPSAFPNPIKDFYTTEAFLLFVQKSVEVDKSKASRLLVDSFPGGIVSFDLNEFLSQEHNKSSRIQQYVFIHDNIFRYKKENAENGTQLLLSTIDNMVNAVEFIKTDDAKIKEVLMFSANHIRFTKKHLDEIYVDSKFKESLAEACLLKFADSFEFSKNSVIKLLRSKTQKI